MADKIVVLDGYTLNPGDIDWKPVQALGEVTLYDRTPEAEILERAAGASCLMLNKTPLARETIDALPELRYVGVLATGYNVVDIEACAGRGVVVPAREVQRTWLPEPHFNGVQPDQVQGRMDARRQGGEKPGCGWRSY